MGAVAEIFPSDLLPFDERLGVFPLEEVFPSTLAADVVARYFEPHRHMSPLLYDSQRKPSLPAPQPNWRFMRQRCLSGP
ncbi:MAG: hypothetical protein M3447_13100 [Acidobacteriota bacterium]|nr:hypothetical protein [Acidobacteriota bacterium]